MKASREAAASSYRRCLPPERDGTASNPACSYQRIVCTLQPLALARVPMECAPGITFPLESTIIVDCRMQHRPRNRNLCDRWMRDMSASCCQQKPAFDGTSRDYRRVLWVVIALNATMFLVEMAA